MENNNLADTGTTLLAATITSASDWVTVTVSDLTQYRWISFEFDGDSTEKTYTMMRMSDFVTSYRVNLHNQMNRNYYANARVQRVSNTSIKYVKSDIQGFSNCGLIIKAYK